MEDAEVKYTAVGATSIPVGATTNATGHSDKSILFTARVPLTIDSATVYWRFDNNSGHENDPINVQFKVTNSPAGYNIAATTITLGPAHSTTISAAMAQGRLKPNWPTSASGIYAVRVPVGISVAAAGDYRLAMENATGNIIVQESMVSYVYPDVSTGGDIAIISSSKLGTNPVTTTHYHDIYNWRVSYRTPCGRVPVRAIADCVLPVEFVEFNATKNNGFALLTWTTAWEENNDYFIVERSIDGINFLALDKVEGNITTQVNSHYLYKDYSAPGGIVYYRLAQYDLDGAVHYSVVRSIYSEKGNEVFIVPNPNSGSFTVSFASAPQADIRMSLINTLGQEVYIESLHSESGNFSKHLHLENLASGIYYLHLQGDEYNSITKIIKE